MADDPYAPREVCFQTLIREPFYAQKEIIFGPCVMDDI